MREGGGDEGREEREEVMGEGGGDEGGRKAREEVMRGGRKGKR